MFQVKVYHHLNVTKTPSDSLTGKNTLDSLPNTKIKISNKKTVFKSNQRKHSHYKGVLPLIFFN